MAKRRRGFAGDDGMTSETLPNRIPLDLFLDILARSDAGTVVRCAATSKAVRRVILGQDFRRPLALRTEANGGGFDPALLLGVSYLLEKDISAAVEEDRVVQSSRQHLRFDASLLLSFDAVASRDGLVVLQQRQTGRRSPELMSVCVDSLAGETCLLPPAAIRHDDYPLALLSVGDDTAVGGRSFQLLAVDRDLRTQTFSSTTDGGKWGSVRQTRYVSQQLPYLAPVLYEDYTSRPIVLGSSSTVQWLRLHCEDPHIVALDVRSAQATRIIDLPPECISRMRCIQDTDTGLLLAALPDGRPAVLTAEILVISMWTLSETAVTPTWILIERQVIGMETGPTGYLRFLGFGQRSGTVLLQMDAVGLVQLNLGSKAEVLVLRHEGHENGRFRCVQLCLHEINLSSLLQAMRPL